MGDDARQGYAYDPRWPWWVGRVFRFAPPSLDYERQSWRDAVLQHDVVQDFVSLIRSRMESHSPLYGFSERMDDLKDIGFP